MSSLNTSIQQCMEALARAIRQENEKSEAKGIQIGKREVKPPLSADNVMLHVENPKESTEKLLG